MEIERKFLVERLPAEFEGAPSSAIEQGYLAIGVDGSEVRVRGRAGRCTLTVKTGRGLARGETEIAVSDDQFAALWPATGGRRVEKVRHEVALGHGPIAEVDVYTGALEGLIVAEIEFPDEAEAARFVPPDWLGREVTDDDAYKNRRLATDGRPGY
jgi:CYTH domain-containing protein